MRSTLPAGWTVVEEITVNGRTVSPGVELAIRGERGRFRFVRRVTTPAASWVDVIGGPSGHEQWRSFREARIRTVHRHRITGRRPR